MFERHGSADARSVEGITVAHFAAQRDKYAPLLRVALEEGASIEAWTPTGETPALVAASRGAHECLRVLVEMHADLDVQASDGRSVVEIAEANGVPPVLDCTPWFAVAATADLAAVRGLLAAPHGKARLRWGLLRPCDEARQLQRTLAGLCCQLVDEAGKRTLSKDGKAILTAMLSAGVVKELPAAEQEAAQSSADAALDRLQQDLDRRQESLAAVGLSTTGVDEYTPHSSYSGDLVMKLDQRDAIPAVLWRWAEHGPTPAYEAFALIQEAFVTATGDAEAAARYVRRVHQNDMGIYAYGAADILVLYGERVDKEFVGFMRGLLAG
jgi:hypothetical protein